MRERTMSFKGFPNVGRFFSTRDYIPGQPIPALILDEDGHPQVNPLKKWVTPYTLVTDPGEITLEAGAVSDPIPMVIDGKGHFEIFDAFFKSSQAAGFTVTLFDADSFGGPDARPILMNREIHVATIASGEGATLPLSGSFSAASSGGRPYRWPETFWMDVSSQKKGAMIVAVFRNLANAENTIRFELHGRRWYYMQAEEAVARRMEEIFHGRPRSLPYFWTTDSMVDLVAGPDAQDYQIRMGDDSWSELHKITAVSADPDWDILLKETSSGRKFMDQAIRASLVFGTGEFPLILAESTLLEPNMKLTASFLYESGADNPVWITLAGRKVFEDPRDGVLLRPGTSPGMEMPR